jgi:hypothetical protein
MAAGSTAHFPSSAQRSMDGMSSDHIEAATITPDANPSNDFCKAADISFFIRKTSAEPVMVPIKGMNKIAMSIIFYLLSQR